MKAQIIPLRAAVLCMDCNAITDAKHDECLACSGRGIYPLHKLLTAMTASDEVKRLERMYQK